MTPSRQGEAPTDDSSTEDDAASQTTEDDPQIPESPHHALAAAAAAPPTQPHHPPPPPVAAQPAPPPSNPPANAPARARPRYELKHSLTGHTMSISSDKFSPDGILLASCGTVFHFFPSLRAWDTHSSPFPLLDKPLTTSRRYGLLFPGSSSEI